MLRKAKQTRLKQQIQLNRPDEKDWETHARGSATYKGKPRGDAEKFIKEMSFYKTQRGKQVRVQST